MNCNPSSGPMRLFIHSSQNPVAGKLITSSLLRTHTTAELIVATGPLSVLFRIERAWVTESKVSVSTDAGNQNREWCALYAGSPGDTRDWMIFVKPAGVALRNIDHLFPPELEGPYAPPPVDFLWARVHDDPRSGTRDLAAPGFWAVRGEHAELVLERLNSAWQAEPGATETDETRIWSQVVRDLPLRKRAFERGEVLCPPVGAVDWKALCSAAFVTIPHWPEPERWKFLQALYFGTYFGDETGLLVNLFDP
jgi:hypothetical protein